MSERALEIVSRKISGLIDKCMTSEISVKEVQTEIINTMNELVVKHNEIMNNESMNEIHISLSKIMFSNNIGMIIVELQKLKRLIKNAVIEIIDMNQNIDWYDEVKRRIVQKDMFVSELMVPQSLQYEKRMELFKQYIKNDIKIKDSSSYKDVVDIIRRLLIMLFIPIHTKATRVGKHNIKILFKCNHSGKTKESCKGRDCKYKLIIFIGYNGINEINENGEHNHSLDYSFVTSKTCPLLKSEKEMIPKRKEDMIEFIANHPHVIIPLKKYRQIQNSNDNEQSIENTFSTNLFYENESFIKQQIHLPMEVFIQ